MDSTYILAQETKKIDIFGVKILLIFFLSRLLYRITGRAWVWKWASRILLRVLYSGHIWSLSTFMWSVKLLTLKTIDQFFGKSEPRHFLKQFSSWEFSQTRHYGLVIYLWWIADGTLSLLIELDLGISMCSLNLGKDIRNLCILSIFLLRKDIKIQGLQ